MAFGTEKKPGSGDYESSSQSFFGKTMRIEGEITSDENIIIEGKVKGQLRVSKTLTIGREGYVEGEISANVVHISGEAEGHLSASEKLVISSEGKYTGNINSDTIKVAEGAQIKGTINTEEKITLAKPSTKPVEEEAEPAETTAQFQEKTEPTPEKEPTEQDPTKPAEKKEEPAVTE